MNRRESIKMLAAAGGGLIALPAWAQRWSAPALAVHPTSFLADEQGILAAVTDTIIPPGNAIGALSVGVDKFLQKLLDQCYEKDVQDNVKAQLQALDEQAQATHAMPFAGCDQGQRQALLLQFANGDKKQQDFFTLIKSETIRGFNTSREVMVNYQKYKPVPGHYYGCVDVKE